MLATLSTTYAVLAQANERTTDTILWIIAAVLVIAILVFLGMYLIPALTD